MGGDIVVDVFSCRCSLLATSATKRKSSAPNPARGVSLNDLMSSFNLNREKTCSYAVVSGCRLGPISATDERDANSSRITGHQTAIKYRQESLRGEEEQVSYLAWWPKGRQEYAMVRLQRQSTQLCPVCCLTSDPKARSRFHIACLLVPTPMAPQHGP
jgi:hypothetical protein